MNVLIMGASSGLGLSLAKLLSARKDNVAVCSRNYHRCSSLFSELAKLSSEDSVLAVPGIGVANFKEVKKFFLAAKNYFKTIDVAINCAGVWASEPFGGIGSRSLEIVDTNAIGTMFFSEAALEIMVSQNRGKIVLVTGSTGGSLTHPAYSASKSFVEDLFLSLNLYLEERLVKESHEIEVLCFDPPSMNTPLWAGSVDSSRFLSPDFVASKMLEMLVEVV